MKSKNQNLQKRKGNNKNANTPTALDSISTTNKPNFLSSFPGYEKNLLLCEQCGFQFYDTEYENGYIVMSLHFIALFAEQSKEQYQKIGMFNILSLTSFILSKENQENESIFLRTSDLQIIIFSGPLIKISRIIFRNYLLSTVSLPKNQKLTFYVYDTSLFPIFQFPISISQIFQFRYAAISTLNENVYNHSVVQYFHSLMKSHNPIFNIKHIPNSLDRQQLLSIFQSLIYIPTIFGITCRNNDTPSMISDISVLVEKSSFIRSIKLMNCNSTSGLDKLAQAISTNNNLPLEELFLNDNEFDDLSPLINSLSTLQSQMTHLSLTDCGLNEETLDLLGSCLLTSDSLKNLNYLGIGGIEFTEDSIKNIIKFIQTSSNLKSLDLSGTKNFSTILKSVPGSSIIDLNLSDCIFDDKSVSQLNHACQFVPELDISGCDLNYFEVSDIISKVGKKLDLLVSIKLNGLNFSKERSFAILRGFLLTDLNKWKSIEMNDTQITSNELFAFQALFLKMKNLEHLSFNSNFKEEDAKTVASLLEIKTLKSISLANCRLASIIPNIIKSKIKVVNLSNNNLSDQEALNLLSCPHLTGIKINDNPFKNFEKIVQVANESNHLQHPPLKHGLSTIIIPNSTYSDEFKKNISEFNIDQHTALNEDLQIPYPFTQKEHNEQTLEIGDPSIYNLNKLNSITIENNSSSDQVKINDLYPEIEIIQNTSQIDLSPSKNDEEASSNSHESKRRNKKLSDKSSHKSKKNHKHKNDFESNSEDQYNYDERQEQSKNYDDENQYENDNQYDQYDNENDYEVESKNALRNERKAEDDDDEIIALLESTSVDHNKINLEEKPASYDSSNSESVTAQNYHHSIPPQLGEDSNSENIEYSKQMIKPLSDIQDSDVKNIYFYSENEEEEESFNIIPSKKANDAKKSSPSKLQKVNLNSIGADNVVSESPESKANKSESNNQYNEYYSDESNENQIEMKKPIKNKSDYNENSIEKKNNEIKQDFKRALFNSENSENEEIENEKIENEEIENEEIENEENLTKEDKQAKQKAKRTIVKNESDGNSNKLGHSSRKNNKDKMHENDSENEYDNKSKSSKQDNIDAIANFLNDDLEYEIDDAKDNNNQNLKQSKIQNNNQNYVDDENDYDNEYDKSRDEKEDQIPKRQISQKPRKSPKSKVIKDEDENNEYPNKEFDQIPKPHFESESSKKLSTTNDEIEYENDEENEDELVSKPQFDFNKNNKLISNNDDDNEYENDENYEDNNKKHQILHKSSRHKKSKVTNDDDQNENGKDGIQIATKSNKNKQSRFSLSNSKKDSKIRTSSTANHNNEEDNYDANPPNINNEEENNGISQIRRQSGKRKSRIPSPYELRKSSPSKRINNSNSNNEIEIEKSDKNDNFKSRIPGPRSPQKLNQTIKQQANENDASNQRVSRRVMFESDENNQSENGKINNLNISSNEEQLMVHKNSNSIPDRHPSLSEEEEAFIRRLRNRNPRKSLNQSYESENYNTDTFSSNSFSPQQGSPGSPNSPIVEEQENIKRRSPSKKKITDENESFNDIDDDKVQTSFIVPKVPEPSPEESLDSINDFITLTSMLFSMPKKKKRNNQISPLILAFSPPFLEDE